MTPSICMTCGAPPNPANFGSLCDTCTTARKARLDRHAAILVAHGQERSEYGQALKGRIARLKAGR